VQYGVVFVQYQLQVVWVRLCFFGVAVGNVRNQVNHVVEGFDRISRSARRIGEENLSLGLVLLPLFQEVVFV
jgi:hypothetical protein